LKKPINPSIQNGEENNETGEPKPPTYLLSPDFEVINLSEALSIVNQAMKMDKKELMTDVKHGIPRRFLEIVVSSPVFYNTNLIPKNKAIYESHFKKFQFSDTEKMYPEQLLITKVHANRNRSCHFRNPFFCNMFPSLKKTRNKFD
jgi:hypothetical protein